MALALHRIVRMTSLADTANEVSVCIATKGRSAGLTRLLSELGRLVFDDIDAPVVGIIVVDNRPESATPLRVDYAGVNCPWRIRWLREPRIGIPFARNRALREVGSRVRYVAFIDDDEYPHRLWLQELIKVQRRCDADVVAGPVLPQFPEPVAEWVRTGRFFERERYQTGAHLRRAATNNALLLWPALRSRGIWFDERLATSGGSDHLYFRVAHNSGVRIVWADEAVVYETVSPARANTRWLVRRAYRIGNTSGLVDRIAPASRMGLLLRAIKAGVWVVRGLVRVPLGLALGRASLVLALQDIARGAGNITGLCGRPKREYT